MKLRNLSVRPLQISSFRGLFFGSTTSRFGSALAPVALAFAILDLTDSVADLGIVVGVRTLANVLFLLFGGVLADRVSRSFLLVGSSIVAGLAQAVTAGLLAMGYGSIPVLTVLAALNGASAAMALPASSALIPQIVPREMLLTANAVSRLGSNFASILGTSLAGLIVVAGGPSWGIGIDALSFFVAAAFFHRIGAQSATSKRDGSMLADMKEGWREFAARRWLWIVVLAFTVINAAGPGATNVLGPVWADDTIGRTAWGVALAGQSVGLVVGGFLSMTLRVRRLLFYGMAWVVASSLPMWFMSSDRGAVLLFLAFALSGLGLEQFGVAWQTCLHQHVPDDVLARVSSYDILGSLIAIPVGQLIVGPAAHAIGLHMTLLICACLITAASLGTLLSRAVRLLAQPVEVQSA